MHQTREGKQWYMARWVIDIAPDRTSPWSLLAQPARQLSFSDGQEAKTVDSSLCEAEQNLRFAEPLADGSYVIESMAAWWKPSLVRGCRRGKTCSLNCLSSRRAASCRKFST
jgi:hypothetical protein